jgi:hypothetical protein
MTKKNRIIEVSNINIQDYFNFRKPSDEALDYIRLTVDSDLDFSATSVDNVEFGLFNKDAICTSNINELIKEINKSLDNDYLNNLNLLKTDDIEFVYFLNFLDEGKNTLCISVELSSKDIGKIYYSLYVKKTKEEYYLWDF